MVAAEGVIFFLTLNASVFRRLLLYDVWLSALYLWSVFQTYIYDAKQHSGVAMYVVTYGVFTLLVRSPFGALLMNVLSGLSLFWLFKLPVMHTGDAYFKFGTFFGMGETLAVLCVQVVFANCMLIWGRSFLNRRSQFSWSLACAMFSAIVVTLMASVVNSRLL